MFNSGVDDNGNLLDEGTIDSHYMMVYSDDPNNPGPESYVVLTNGFPLPPWIPQGPNSMWIAPTADQKPYDVVGFFDYQITFDLTGFDPATAQLSGQFATDNEMFDILINGQSTGINNGFTDMGQWGRWAQFSTDQGFGFVAGVNTVVFHTHNDGGPAGLRMEISGTANPP